MPPREPLITTIIPTYRRPEFLRRAILSALEQNVVHSKICIYDNASNDGTAEVAKEFSKEHRVYYFCHPNNIGSLANFQYGISKIDTPFFSFLSDDDYLLPEFYSRALDALRKNPLCMFWAGLTINVDEHNTIWDARIRRWPRDGVFSPPEGFFSMTGGMAPTWTGILFRRDVINQIGSLDPSILGPGDLEYCLRISAKLPYYLERHPSAVFTLNSESFSATAPLQSFWPGWKQMFKKFETDDSLPLQFRTEAVNTLRKDAVRMLFRRGANALANGRYDFANDAADALGVDCHLRGRSAILRFLSRICHSSSLAQQIYTSAYRLSEKTIIQSRSQLQSQYGHLLRPL